MGNRLGQTALRQYHGALALCLDDRQRARFERPSLKGWERIEELLRELFRLQDLNRNGFLEEVELIKVNEKIALLHHGPDANLDEVKELNHRHFREKFDAEGRPVPFEKFREHMTAELDELTEHRRDWREQEMILEQWIAEVESARAAFFIQDLRSPSDADLVSKLSFRASMMQGVDSSPPSASRHAGGLHGSHDGTGTSSYTLLGSEPLPGSRPVRVPTASAASFDSDFRPAPLVEEHLKLPESQHIQYPVGSIPGVPASSVGSFVPYPNCSVGSFVPHPNFRAPNDGIATPGVEGSARSSRAPPQPSMPDGGLATGPLRSLPSGDPLEDSFVPHPALAMGIPDYTLPSGPASPALPSSVSQDSFVPSPGMSPPSRTLPASHDQVMPLGLTEGAPVQVWSDSQRAWLDAVVSEAFFAPTSRDGFVVPAGTVKVSSASGVKWILPERASQLLRAPRPSTETRPGGPLGWTPGGHRPIAPRFAKGDAVQVWSASRNAWLPGVVREAFTLPSRRDGFFIPAGTLKVTSAAGDKWILPEKVAEVLKAAVSAPSSPAGGAGGAGSVARPSSPPCRYAAGERVQVWSESRRSWLDATVLEVFEVESNVDGYAVPAGALKVRSEAGDKWVMPADAGRILRKAEASPPCETAATGGLRRRLAAVLSDPQQLERHVSAVWVDCGPEGLARDRLPWALEGLAAHFDVRLDLEGEHVAAVWSRVATLGLGRADHLSKSQFRDLSKALIMELHSSMSH